jgi:hypothetical protein
MTAHSQAASLSGWCTEMRRVVIGSAVIGTVMLLAGCGGGSGTSPVPTPSGTTPAASSAPAPTPTAAALTPGESRFVAAVRKAQGGGGGGDDSTITGAGHSVCSARRAGASEAALIGVSRQHGIKSRTGMSGRQFVRTAERDLCPSELARIPRVLLNFSGNGIGNSAPFLVLGNLTVHYTFDCSSQGTGNFIGDIETGNQASLNSDDQSFANELSGGGSKTTHVYPQEPGHDYHVSVNSECSWTVVVKG